MKIAFGTRLSDSFKMELESPLFQKNVTVNTLENINAIKNDGLNDAELVYNPAKRDGERWGMDTVELAGEIYLNVDNGASKELCSYNKMCTKNREVNPSEVFLECVKQLNSVNTREFYNRLNDEPKYVSDLEERKNTLLEKILKN